MDIHHEIQEQLNAGFNYREIRLNLLQKGFSVKDIQDAFDQSYAKQDLVLKEKHPILTSRYLGPAVLIGLLVLFLIIIPKSFLSEHDMLCAFLGGIPFGIFMFVSIAKLFPKILDQYPILTGITCIFSFIGFSILILSTGVDFKSNDLKENGITTTARVIDGKIKRVKRNEVATLEIKFFTKEGQEYNTEINVNSNRFNEYYQGQEIMIEYSSKHPNMVREVSH